MVAANILCVRVSFCTCLREVAFYYVDCVIIHSCIFVLSFCVYRIFTKIILCL